MNNAIIKSAGDFIIKHTAKLQKHSPEILVVAGVVGTVTSAVMACKATTKAGDILDEAQEKIDQVHQVMNDESISDEDYTPEDSKKDLAIIYAQTGLKFVKLYGPSIALGALSIASILGGHNILRKRNVALAAAYTALDGSFKDYRKRVIERFGETVDRELKYNLKAKKITEAVTDEDGKTKKEKFDAEILDDDAHEYSDYARFYDDGCTGWSKDPEYNLMFLKAQQQYANDLLRSRGHLFLNEVYDMLGIPRTKAGQVVGWIYNENNPVGDNYVDFGLYDIRRRPVRDFVNGYERVILLDFNVDGVIYDLI